jgi:hypothetical protein
MDFSLVVGWNLIQTSLGPPHDGGLGTAVPRTFFEPVPVRERFAATRIVSMAQQHPETHVVISCRVYGLGSRLGTGPQWAAAKGDGRQARSRQGVLA